MREEMTNEHLTTEICMAELATCQDLSIGPNFVYFGGQKYGYRPIPTFIPTQELKLMKVITLLKEPNMCKGLTVPLSVLHIML